MAGPGFVRRAMIYLGLVDDEYEDYDVYEEASSGPARSRRVYGPSSEAPEPVTSSIRTIQREDTGSGISVTPRPSVVRPIIPTSAKVHVVAPIKFPDAQEIGDRFKAGQPVIVNLQGADKELSRRMIDFCSGATYALGGSMDKVADQVFLLTPSNVEVSAEEKRRLQERGLYRS